MTKLSMIPISLALVAGIAHAQAPKGDKPATPADKPAPPAAEKKAPPADSKPNPDAKPVMPKPPEPPKPAQELTDMIKGMTGTWKCTGQAEIMGTMMDVKATIAHKADLGGW